MRCSLLLLLAVGCGGPPTAASSPVGAEAPALGRPIAAVPLGVADEHFHTVPVRVGGRVDTTFILDTGIGLALVSRALCERIGCVENGSFEGRRMSGQSVRLPLTTIPSIELGDYVQRDVVAGIVDIEGFFPEPQIEGFLGLPSFRDAPFTIDAAAGALIVESPATLAARERTATAVQVRLDVQGPAIDAFVPAVLPSGERAEVLMDTGSRGVTLHTRYAAGLAIDLEGAAVRRREGQDETGHTYVRYFTELPSLAIAAAPSFTRPNLRVMFQEIIHDGLIGTEFMSSFTLTFDVARSRVLFARRADAPAPREE